MENDLGTMISSLMGNPEVMREITALAGKLKEETPPVREKTDPQNETPPFSLPLPVGQGRAGDLIGLLTALKPFLGKEKRKTVEEAIGILQLIGMGAIGLGRGGNR